MAALPLSVNYLHKVKMEYHSKFGHTLERINRIGLISVT